MSIPRPSVTNHPIWFIGPVAFDQRYEHNGFQLTRGGCAANGGVVINTLSDRGKRNFGAGIISSVGPDYFNVDLYQVLGTSYSYVMKKKPYLKLELYPSDKRTTSFKQIESHSGLKFELDGNSITDLERPDIVWKCLEGLEKATFGYPKFITVTGGTAEMQINVMNMIRSYERHRDARERSIRILDYGPTVSDYQVHNDLQIPARGANIIKMNKQECWHLTGHKNRGPSILLKLMSSDPKGLIVSHPRGATVYTTENHKCRKTELPPKPVRPLKVPSSLTAGCGDMLLAAFQWFLYDLGVRDISDLTPDKIIRASYFGVQSSREYLQIKADSDSTETQKPGINPDNIISNMDTEIYSRSRVLGVRI